MLSRSPMPMRRTHLKRTALLPERPTKRHPKPSGPDILTVARVLARAMRDDVLCCEVCGVPVFGDVEGAQHKAWVIDQMVRALTGAGYDAWVAAYNADGSEEIDEWDVGVAP